MTTLSSIDLNLPSLRALPASNVRPITFGDMLRLKDGKREGVILAVRLICTRYGLDAARAQTAVNAATSLLDAGRSRATAVEEGRRTAARLAREIDPQPPKMAA